MQKTIVVFGLFLLLIACKNNILYEEDNEIKGSNWNVDSIISFDFNILDTTTIFYSTLKIRHTTSYPYQNLFVFIHTTLPNEDRQTDTVECILADKIGKWNGKITGNIVEFSKIHKKTLSFKVKGKCIIKTEQAMRYGNLTSIKNIPEILSLGICIKAKEN